MPTLVQINVCAGIFSTGKIVSDIGAVVSKNGWQSVVAGRYDVCLPCPDSHLIHIGSPLEKYAHFLYSLMFDRHGRFGKRSTKKLIKIIEDYNPDIVHLHNLHGYYLDIGTLLTYLKQKKVPTIVTTHDCWLLTGHCAHFSKIACTKWMTHCSHCPLKNSYPRALIDNSFDNHRYKKALFSGFDNLHFVAVSEWLGRVVASSYLGEYPIQVIPNGVDLSLFHPLQLFSSYSNVLNKDRYLLAVSSVWYNDKGLEDFFKLNERLPQNVHICLVGLSDSQINRLPQGIIGRKRTSSIQELVDLYNKADIVLSLSKSETFGLTIAEGFACGTPAIVYDNTALPELITKETGRIIRTGDIEGVLSAVREILEIGKESFSTHCRIRAEQLYNKEKNYIQYFRLYQSILCR